MHSYGIPHGKLKCSNILVDNDGIIKISDYAGAKKWLKKGFEQYKSPEMLKGTKGVDSRRADIWALGCTIVEILKPDTYSSGLVQPGKLHNF